MGGGIKDGTGVPLATGVLAFDSDLISPLLLAATARLLDLGDEESFGGDSSLMDVLVYLFKSSGLSFNVTILLLMDFRRGAEVAEEGLFAFAEAIVTDRVERMCRKEQ